MTEKRNDEENDQSGEEQRSSGGQQNERSTGSDRGRSSGSGSSRGSNVVESSVGGDQAGVAGGAIDSKVTGRGGGA
ncbi:MAG TPA: hypothetical protein VNJ02_12810 [Vicinamibacterales bacterium]|nr:hypothetical protein [Vicinamibacterales bacterium]